MMLRVDRLLLILVFLGACQFPTERIEPPRTTVTQISEDKEVSSVSSHCEEWLRKLPGKFEEMDLKTVCEKSEFLPTCNSENEIGIFHYNRQGTRESGTRILALGVIHGDEPEGGAVTRSWMERLSRIEPRNTWRVVPIVNPDGLLKNTRTNKNGVDINRNFPTLDWEAKALEYWKDKGKGHPRRFPGTAGASEAETRCVVNHIEDFKPALIVALHTPYGVLDFDGPKLKFPQYSDLPWIRLGNFPGSLGRYMWKDRGVPVLTIELKSNESLINLDKFDRLQDITGLVSIMLAK